MSSAFGAAALALGVMTALVALPAAAAERAAPANLAVIELAREELAARGVEPIALGELEAPTGKIVATDPLVQPERPAFERAIPPGRYPIKLYKAQGRIALAELRVAPGKVARWEVATVPGQNLKTLKDDEIFGYGVDAGLGSFMDAAGASAMKTREQTLKAPDNYYDDILANELTANGDDRLLHKPLPDDPVNVAIFSSGWGDGFYASYWGFDAEGRALVLATDFGVLENGDGRSEFDKIRAAALAAMTPEQRDDARKAHEALKSDDLVALKDMLASGRVTPETYLEEAGDGLTFEAIRLDKPAALELLVRYGARLEMDPSRGLTDIDLKTYPDYLRWLDNPPKLDMQLPKDFKPRQPSSAALKDVVARWEAGSIPPAPDAPPRKPDPPPPGETPGR